MTGPFPSMGRGNYGAEEPRQIATHLRPSANDDEGRDGPAAIAVHLFPSKKARRVPVHAESSEVVSRAVGNGRSARTQSVRRDR